MAVLRTDYVDDVLNTAVNTNRRFRMINNGDGTVSFEDVTDYTVEGDGYGATQINEQNEAINEINTALTNVMKKRTFSGSVTVPANGTARIDIPDVTIPDGYQLMGVIGFSSSSSHVYFVNSGVYTASTSTYSINVATDYSSGVTSTIGVTLLFIADDIIL